MAGINGAVAIITSDDAFEILINDGTANKKITTTNLLKGVNSTVKSLTSTDLTASKLVKSSGSKILESGTVATVDIDADAVTYEKIQNVTATDRLLGRSTALAGIIEEITVGGDITQSGSTFTIGADKVTYDKMQDTSATDRLLGRSTALAGTIEEITVAGDITQSGSTFTIADDAVTYAKMQNVTATNKLLGRDTAGAGVVEELGDTAVKTMLALENVSNTADADKPVSTAGQTALNLKETVANVDTLKGVGWGAETVKGNSDNVATLNGAVGAAGSVLKSIKDNAQTGTFTPIGAIAAVTIGTALAELDSEKIAITQKGAANGVAPLTAGSLIDSVYLPSYVDDVIEVADYASLPVTGETGKIYVTIDTGYTYRWSGSAYVQLTDATALWGQISGTLSAQTDLQNALDLKESIANVDTLKGVGWTDETVMDNVANISDHETRITAIEQTLPTLGIKFESLPAVTSGTRMSGASSLTFRVNAGSMDLDVYPATDIRNYAPYSGIKTAKINDDMVIQAYIDDPGFAAASGHIMTWIPKFYTRIVSATEFYIRPVQASGYTIEPAFYDYANSEENDGIWVGSLPGTLDSADGTTKLDSLLGKTLQVSRTMPQLRTSAQANGTGFGLMDIATRDALRKLILIAMGNTNSQSVISAGVTSESTQVLVTEGNLLAMGNESGYIGANTDVPVSFFGIWDLWGNIWQWLDGIFKVDKEKTIDVTSAADTDIVTVNGTALTKGDAADWQDAATLASAIDALTGVTTTADGNVVTAAAGAGYGLVVTKTENAGTITIAVTKYGIFYTYDETYYDAIIGTVPATLANYTEHAENLPLTNGYIGVSAGTPAIPTSLTGGGSATGWCDYFYQAAGYRGLLVGGSWARGSIAGFFGWDASVAPSYADSSLGSRLLGKP